MAAPLAALVARLESQLQALDTVLWGATPEGLGRRPAPGEWSAREHLAHLARHHAVFLERMRRILLEDRPSLGRYRAEEDPEWSAWIGLAAEESVSRLRATRDHLLDLVRPLSPAHAARAGLHPTFGAMALSEWLDFCLLHEAHHLYVVMTLVGGHRSPRG
jgi:hypothetical protein